MNYGKVLVAGVFALSIPGTAFADTIDFNSATDPVPASNTIVIGSVSITRQGVEKLLVDDAPNGTGALLGRNVPLGSPVCCAGSQWIATFASPVMNVSIDLGDFGDDSDTIFLTAFNAANSQIGSVSEVLASSFSGMRTLQLNLTGIKSISFGDSAGGGIYADNLTFSPVPIPAMLPVFAAAAGFLGFIGWRTRRRALLGP